MIGTTEGVKSVKIAPICKGTSQPAFTCSSLTIETLEQGVEYVRS